MARSIATRRSTAAALPQWIAPQLTQLVDAAPDGDAWLHEIKFDGYRMHARLDRGAAKLLTRTGLDWTHKYPAIAAAVSSLGARQAYLDGRALRRGPDPLWRAARPADHRSARLGRAPGPVGRCRGRAVCRLLSRPCRCRRAIVARLRVDAHIASPMGRLRL